MRVVVAFDNRHRLADSFHSGGEIATPALELPRLEDAVRHRHQRGVAAGRDSIPRPALPPVMPLPQQAAATDG